MQNKVAFTLIELLVVVLIIGILAAVAVPQYQKAVRKARVAEAKVILKQVTDAQDIYLLSNDDTPTFADLDIEIPESTNNWQFYRGDCATGHGGNGRIGCENRAIPQWEEGYEIGYASPNYASGIFQTSGHFFCTDDETICTCLGGIESEGLYILP